MIDNVAASYAGKRVLVTGASGFLGRHLVDQLSGYGCTVVAASRRTRTDRRHNVKWIQADLSEPDRVRDVFAYTGFDIVFHLASESRGNRSVDNVLSCFRNDLESTINCLMAAHALGCPRFVMTGSLEEPDMPPGGNDRVPIPDTPYAAAKFAGVLYGKMFHRNYGLPVIILRPFMTYGPGQKEYKVIPYTILSLLKGEPPKLSSGNRLIDWIYVSDVVDAFVRAGIVPSVPDEILELGSQSQIPLREVVQKIHGFLGGPSPVFGTMPEWGLNGKVANTHSTFQTLGWKPSVTINDGLRHTIDWYRQECSQTKLGAS